MTVQKESLIVRPLSAAETGLVPDWCDKVEEELEGDIELSKLDFSYCPVHDGEDGVNGDTMLVRAKAEAAMGTLGFGKIILDLHEQGKDVVPPEVQVVILPCTILRRRGGDRSVPYLYRRGAQLVLNFFWLGYDFSRRARLVRPRE